MKIMGEGYYRLVAAIGEIPTDIQFFLMDEMCVDHAKFRVIPFEFDFGPRGKESGIVKCIHPNWFSRYDEIIGNK